jgi:hypothetical protein
MLNGRSIALATSHIGQQSVYFLLDHGVAFACVGLQSGPIKHFDVATAVTDQARALQFPGRFCNAFSAHAEHAGDQFLRHDQLVRRQSIERQQQPAAQLLLD